MGALYLVATPIGNLEDTSARAIRVLKEARLIACEDTRHTAKLLQHFGIKTRTTSYFEHNKTRKLETVIAALDSGDVALVSDAGTPGLNDPGFLLVRAALEAGHTVTPVPGPSAPIAALVISGLPTDKFLYLGYLPRRAAERRKAVQEVAGLPYTLIWLEAPHRLTEALSDLQEILGDRQIAVAGELTKMYEAVFRGPLSAAQAHFAEYPARGEFTLVVAGNDGASQAWSREQVQAELESLLADGERASDIARNVAAASGWPRSEVYDLLTSLKQK